MSDNGVEVDEGLALVTTRQVNQGRFKHLFKQPYNENYGAARNLSPFAFYCAMRWNYTQTSVKQLQSAIVRVKALNGNVVWCTPADWGPNARTGRIIDLSPMAAEVLGVKTDDLVKCTLILPDDSEL